MFRTALREAEPRGPTSGLRLLNGIDGDWVENFEAGSEKLAKQIATPLNWAACLESCWAAGARRALELGREPHGRASISQWLRAFDGRVPNASRSARMARARQRLTVPVSQEQPGQH